MNHATNAALAVKCPKCKAAPGENCRTAKLSPHTARTSAGLSASMRDVHRRHERRYRAAERVKQAVAAGRPPVDYDITLAIAGCCSDTDCSLAAAVELYASIPAAHR